MANRVNDMTAGRPAGLITKFALPLILGNLFQQMYTITDAAIVGQFAGVTALGAVGCTDWLSWFWFGLITGFVEGMAILIAQRFGAKDMLGMKRAVSTITTIALVMMVVFTAIGFTVAGPMLRLLNTPDEMYILARNYLLIIYAGIPVSTVYNTAAAFLRALGNSRVPLFAMVTASITNVALDLLFVAKFGWGVEGAAAASVIGMCIACTICVTAVLRIDLLKYQKGEFVFAREDVKKLFKLGAPMAFQNTIIYIGGMVLQSVINGLGTVFVSGFAATNKFYGLLECAASSFGLSVTTFVGQNLGAKKYDRIKKGVRSALCIGIGISVFVACVMIFFGRQSLRLFISSDADPNVIKVAYKYLLYMAYPLPILYLLWIYRCALQGMGDTFMPMMSGVGECIARIGTALILVYLIGSNGIYYAEPAAWTAATIVLSTTYYCRRSRLGKI